MIGPLCSVRPKARAARSSSPSISVNGKWAPPPWPLSVIAQTLEPKPMNDLIQGLRRRLGMQIIPSGKAVPKMFRCIARKETLGMLIDVVEPGDGVKVAFF